MRLSSHPGLLARLRATNPRGRGRSGREDERGATLILVGFFLVALLIVTALVVDIAYAKQERRQTQNAADAAALAAAQELDGQSGQITRAIQTAMDYVEDNLPDVGPSAWIDCTDPDPLAYVPTGQATYGCVSFDSSETPTQVRVRVPEASPAFFGQVMGWDTYDVSSDAIAARSQTTGTGGGPAGPCGLCIIDGNLQMANITTVQVTGGGIYGACLTANMQDSLPASQVQPLPLRWKSCNNSNWGRNVQPRPQTFNSRYEQVSEIPNPFEDVTVTYPAERGISGSDDNISWCRGWQQGRSLQPDVMYRQSVNLSCGGTIDLAPGTYYFGNNLQVGNGVTLRGTDVTLVFGCTSNDWRNGYPPRKCNGSEGGKFNFGPGSTVDISAPTGSSAPYPKFAILFDETERSGSPNQLSGDITLDGAIYGNDVGFNLGSNSAIVRSWTIVGGGNTFDFNQGSLFIDNTKFGGGSAEPEPTPLGEPGAVTLIG